MSAPHPIQLPDGADKFATTSHPWQCERRLVSREANKREVARPPPRSPQMALAKASDDQGASHPFSSALPVMIYHPNLLPACRVKPRLFFSY